MSEEQPDERESMPYLAIRLTEPGAWYWLGVMFPHLVRSLAEHLEPSRAMNSGYGTQCDVVTRDIPPREVGRAVFNGPGPGDAPAAAQLYSLSPEYDSFWDMISEHLQAAQHRARSLRRTHEGISPDEALEMYYRNRAAGGKMTLKQLAEQTGISHSWLRQRKMEYDKAGKWGSRPNSETNIKNDT